MKKHNFNAGPSILADEVIENAAKAILDFNGSGLSLLSISHRTKDFDDVMAEADVLFRELLHIPDNYKIIYLGGGASTYFYEIPANFLGRKAGYVNTGVWAKKAIKEAKRYGEVEVLASSEDRNFTYIPKGFAIPADLDYVHITSNNTIYGTEYQEFPHFDVPVVCDMSSDILSRRVNVADFDLIYAGAQKNLGPAGVTIAIVKKDFLATARTNLPTMLKYQTFADKDSLYNTPPVFAIYMVNKTLHWIQNQGGVDVIQARNAEKAALIYDAIDQSGGFYIGHAEKPYRSKMNITFNLQTPEMEKDFIARGKELGFVGLGGHRSVGGCRASAYNAVPLEACQALADYMKQYQKDHE